MRLTGTLRGRELGLMMRNSTRRSHRAFTILEMMVTIGILVVVTAGVATIFRSIGTTVDKGRRISELNQFAARLERVMREDFHSMTRDGFLVIVNKNANRGNDVPLYRGDQSNIDEDLYPGFSGGPGRIRRSDEIMFFTRGDYQTSRPAIANGMIAKSHEAAIYYGLGQKRRPMTSAGDPAFDDYQDNLFFNPATWDNNFDSALDTRLGHNTPGFVNPNQFARDWSLLRHVTLLALPDQGGMQVPLELFGLQRSNQVSRRYLQDSDRQIALQPAARSIFTSLSGTDLGLPANEFPNWLFDLNGQVNSREYPNDRASGLVDIVTEDLATIRGLIQALPVNTDPSFYFNHTPADPPPASNPVGIDRDAFATDFWGNAGAAPSPQDALSFNAGVPINNGRNWNVTTPLHVNRMRRWMVDALPSRWDLSIRTTSGDFTANQFVGGVRYEDVPTRLLFADNEFTAGNSADEILRAYAEANQEMLGASVFVPRCTEFIVEWSYGFVDHTITNPADPEYKKLVWYGLDRRVDSNQDGLLNTDDAVVARTYRQRTGAQAGADPSTTPAVSRARGMPTQLVVGRLGLLNAPPDAVDIAAFGFDADTTPPATGSPNLDSAWVWPKFIRITMSLGDPNDRDVEETYQVIFEVPEASN